MTHPIRAAKPYQTSPARPVRFSYPSCSLDQRSRADQGAGPTWEDLLGQR